MMWPSINSEAWYSIVRVPAKGLQKTPFHDDNTVSQCGDLKIIRHAGSDISTTTAE